MKVPEPQVCFDCRQVQKLAFRNERKLYHATCKLCRKSVISIYSSDKPCTIYCTNCWWGDGWDPLQYGRDFDFKRPFFEQFAEVFNQVPKLSLLSLGEMVNSDYCHDVLRAENCYLVFDGEQAKDCYYGETFTKIQDCMDFLFIQRCELCYECTNCNDCYNVNFSQYSYNCADSNFLFNCRGCRNCFGCANLQQKEYHIFNKPYSPEVYKKKVAELKVGNYAELQKMKTMMIDFFESFPKKYINGIMNENVTGDNLNYCKDTFDSYDSEKLRDCRYCSNMLMGANDCYDINIWGNHVSLAYNGAGIGENAQNIIGCYYVAFGAENIFHSAYCFHNNKDLFGCVGLQHKSFCILNKQYTKEEYEILVPKIIDHMKKTGEWGNFFPSSIADFGYNETVAQEYYPLNKEEALKRGFKWKDSDPKEYKAQTVVVPENIGDVTDAITKEILACSDCNKNYKLIPQELKFYRAKNIPVPRKCPDCRHLDRLKLRNSRQLFNRKCSNCQAELQSSYEVTRKDPVLCEKCYLGVVFT